MALHMFGSTTGSMQQRRAACQGRRGLAARRPVVARAPGRRTGPQVAAFFNFLSPKSSAAAAPPRARELKDALIDVCSSTKGGAAASPDAKEEIEQLVRAPRTAGG